MFTKETRIGKVRAVTGGRVIAAIDPDLPDLQPVIHGRTHNITQIGTLLKIQVGAAAVIGLVARASATSIEQREIKDEDKSFAWSIAPGEKWLELNLFGEIRNHLFERGVTYFPDVDSEVHVIEASDLKKIFDAPVSDPCITFGELSGGMRQPALLNLQRLFMRHSAIVGSTGSGKSNAVWGRGHDVVEVSSWLGHKSIDRTYRDYMRWTKLKLRLRVVSEGDQGHAPQNTFQFNDLLGSSRVLS